MEFSSLPGLNRNWQTVFDPQSILALATLGGTRERSPLKASFLTAYSIESRRQFAIGAKKLSLPSIAHSSIGYTIPAK